jgi:DNA mismatch repair protein MSH2
MDFQEFLENDQKLTILQVTEKLGQVTISAVVFYRIPISLQTADDYNKKSFQLQIDIYEFLDNQQFSGLDTFCNQIGQSVYMLSDELEDVSSRVLAKKLNMLFEMRNLERKFIKKSLFLRKGSTVLEKFSQRSLITESLVSAIELERNLSISCLECLAQLFDLPASFPEDSTFEMKIKSLDSFMRLDTPASDAINLLPKPDQPSIYGSLYGILNRCKTKMGQKTLERWLRQPLLSKSAIDERLNLVELFSLNTIARNKLRDGPLKNIPDLDTVSSKLRKKTAGLQEMFRLYLFVKSLPLLLQILQELNPAANQTEMNEDSNNDNDDTKSQELFATLQSKYLTSLQQIAGKFALYEQLIEHVIDFDALPDYKINPKHDPELQELAEEQKGLEIRAEKVLNDAKASYASFAEVRLERSSQYGFNLRTTKGDDEKQLRANNSSVRILSILKNGTHFTTPILERIADRYLTIEREYHEKQQELVDKALATALTYLPLIESVAVLVSEIDVLQSFAQAAALSPNGYIRPTILPRGSGILKLHNARHPCVELMDNVTFIANDYEMIRDESNFQIITGPNMGGKSTYIRGIGSIVVMAQIGMFVPCEMAEISIVDCILARVGAGDAVQKGVSTFMAEMVINIFLSIYLIDNLSFR